MRHARGWPFAQAPLSMDLQMQFGLGLSQKRCERTADFYDILMCKAPLLFIETSFFESIIYFCKSEI